MNEKLKKLISIPPGEATDKDDELLIRELKKAELIMPIEVTSEEEFEFTPLKIGDEFGNIFVPLFSDEDELIKSDVEFSVINISAENLAKILSDEFNGVAINPFSEFQLKIPLNEFKKLFE